MVKFGATVARSRSNLAIHTICRIGISTGRCYDLLFVSFPMTPYISELCVRDFLSDRSTYILLRFLTDSTVHAEEAAESGASHSWGMTGSILMSSSRELTLIFLASSRGVTGPAVPTGSHNVPTSGHQGSSGADVSPVDDETRSGDSEIGPIGVTGQLSAEPLFSSHDLSDSGDGFFARHRQTEQPGSSDAFVPDDIPITGGVGKPLGADDLAIPSLLPTMTQWPIPPEPVLPTAAMPHSRPGAAAGKSVHDVQSPLNTSSHREHREPHPVRHIVFLLLYLTCCLQEPWAILIRVPDCWRSKLKTTTVSETFTSPLLHRISQVTGPVRHRSILNAP